MNDISVIQKANLDEVLKLLSKSHFQPYRYLLGKTTARQLRNFLSTEIMNLFSNELHTCCVILKKGSVLGIGFLEELPWDSEIFNLKMARIKYLLSDDQIPLSVMVKDKIVTFLVNVCLNKKIKHVSCKVNTDDITSIHVLENNGFRLMDTLLDYTFEYNRSPISDIKQSHIIRSFKKEDINGIIEVARTAFGTHFGRFNVDNELKKNASKFYVKWAESSCRSDSDTIFVAELNKKIVGYSIWKENILSKEILDIDVGAYSIGAVHPIAYGKGIFKALTYTGMKRLKGKVDIIVGPTHINNYPVQRGYASLHWKIVNARHTFHRYFKKGSGMLPV